MWGFFLRHIQKQNRKDINSDKLTILLDFHLWKKNIRSSFLKSHFQIKNPNIREDKDEVGINGKLVRNYFVEIRKTISWTSKIGNSDEKKLNLHTGDERKQNQKPITFWTSFRDLSTEFDVCFSRLSRLLLCKIEKC